MRTTASIIALFLSLALSAQTISYKGQEVELGPHAFLVDANSELVSPYVFKSFNEAVSKLSDGTADDPMRVYIAPWVYWVDDPDDGQIRRNPDLSTPIGLTVRCNSLQLLGMGEDPRDVILASARGQSQGSVGNFTMFDIYGNDFVVKDLTMGNYCNIDLVYPKHPELGRKARYSAITQAQLAFGHGDRYYAENVRFEARLNLCPLNGSKRTLFVNCHFELTDDSLNGTAVHIGCDFDYYGRQPFGSASIFGTVFLDCDFNICHAEPVQAVSKGVYPHSLLDCRFHAGRPVELAWTFRPEEWLRCYQYNISLDGAPAFVGAAKPYNTVLLDQRAQLGAYRLIEEDGSVLYNSFNLLRGEDDWDPMGIRSRVEALSQRDHRDYGSIPTSLVISQRSASIQTGGEPLKLSAAVYRHNGYKLDNQQIRWKAQSGFERYLQLSTDCGNEVVVTAANSDDRTLEFDLIAYTDSGLESAVKLSVAPDFVEAPTFLSSPRISVDGGLASVSYELDLGSRKDESLVTWYRCDDRRGGGAVPVAVSRGGKPLKTYRLQSGDRGKYLMVGVAPKHLRCEAGEEVRVVASRPVKASQTPAQTAYSSDFSDFPCSNQTSLRPGYWTIDAFKPEDTRDYQWSVDLSKPCWTWGPGINGAKGLGIQQLQQGARLRYTPVEGKYGDMSVCWQLDPAKDGGQGFASARMQYLDLFIKFDTRTLSGYALRAIRTTKYANAVDVVLVRYDNGMVSNICEPVTVDCFLTGCVMKVWTEGNMLKARVEGPMSRPELASDPNVHRSADLSAPIGTNSFGGFGLQHTSTVGTESRILIHSVDVQWR